VIGKDGDLEVGNFTQIGDPLRAWGFSWLQVLVFRFSHTMKLHTGYQDMYDSQFSKELTLATFYPMMKVLLDPEA
jgi:hypothetical protein